MAGLLAEHGDPLGGLPGAGPQVVAAVVAHAGDVRRRPPPDRDRSGPGFTGGPGVSGAKTSRGEDVARGPARSQAPPRQRRLPTTARLDAAGTRDGFDLT